jgi:hypothetical protein
MAQLLLRGWGASETRTELYMVPGLDPEPTWDRLPDGWAVSVATPPALPGGASTTETFWFHARPRGREFFDPFKAAKVFPRAGTYRIQVTELFLTDPQYQRVVIDTAIAIRRLGDRINPTRGEPPERWYSGPTSLKGNFVWSDEKPSPPPRPPKAGAVSSGATLRAKPRA